MTATDRRPCRRSRKATVGLFEHGLPQGKDIARRIEREAGTGDRSAVRVLRGNWLQGKGLWRSCCKHSPNPSCVGYLGRELIWSGFGILGIAWLP